jgi:rhodanese-related sulfurtransferase
MTKGLWLTSLAVLVLATPLSAQQSRITSDMVEFSFVLNGARVSIGRNGAACPPACLQPMQSVPGVNTIGELEVMAFLDSRVATGTGLLIDARSPGSFDRASIPGAINVPAATLRPENPYREDLLNELRGRQADFSGAFDLVVFADGPDAPEAVEALRDLTEAGYPAGKLKYYRGGMTVWTVLGLDTTGLQ